LFWATASPNAIEQRLKTDLENGLSFRVARKRGAKIVAIGDRGKAISFVKIILHQFVNPLVYLLLLSATISALIGRPRDAYFILVIVFINVLFGIIREKKADNALRVLHHIAPDRSLVVRGGKVVEVSASSIVPGDVIILSEEQKVPADARVFYGVGLEVNEAPLTGEAMAVAKTSSSIVLAGNRSVAQKNMVFYGSSVVAGYGRAVVVATGNKVRFASTLAKASVYKNEKTPLEKEITHLAKILLFFAGGAAVLAFVAFLLATLNWKESLVYLINLFVAIMPGGLPAVATLALAVVTYRMANKKVVTRRLMVADMLGNVDLVLVDKTGTVTTGKMKVRYVWTKGVLYSARGGSRLRLWRGGEGVVNSQEVKEVLTAGILANNARLVYGLKSNGSVGDGLEIAMLDFAHKLNSSLGNQRWHRIDEVVFPDRNKLMAVLARKDKEAMIFAKGAPEVILRKAEKVLGEDGELKLSQARRDELNSRYLQLARNGYKVIALARKKVGLKKNSLSEKDLTGLTVLGIYAIEDSVRKDVAPTVKELESAGIEVKLVADDHASTAFAVAHEVGIAKDRDFVVAGSRISALLATHRDDVLERAKVFARMSPENKLELVEHYKKKGKNVAFVGGDVSDVVAIKAANVGVALSGDGREATRETADVVLLDSSFNVLAQGLREGITARQNLRKVLYFLLSTNMAEFTVIFSALVLALPSPFSAIQILWINLVANTVADEALALESPEKKLLKQKSRYLLSPLVLRRVAVATLGQIALVMTIYFWALNNFDVAMVSSFTLVALVGVQIFNLLSARSLNQSFFNYLAVRNYWFLAAVALIFVLLIASIYFAPLSGFLGLSAIESKYFVAILLLSTSIMGIIEIDKLFTNRGFGENGKRST